MSLNSVRQHVRTASVLSTTVRRDETGSAPTETRSLNRPHPNHEGGGLVDIVPAAKPSATPPPFPDQMARADGCPVCIVNYVLPKIAREQENGFVAYYSCEDCGHDWITSWKD